MKKRPKGRFFICDETELDQAEIPSFTVSAVAAKSV